MTHSDAMFVMALLFIIAINVAEMNLRQEGFQWPWVGAFVGVLITVICFALAFKVL